MSNKPLKKVFGNFNLYLGLNTKSKYDKTLSKYNTSMNFLDICNRLKNNGLYTFIIQSHDNFGSRLLYPYQFMTYEDSKLTNDKTTKRIEAYVSNYPNLGREIQALFYYGKSINEIDTWLSPFVPFPITINNEAINAMVQLKPILQAEMTNGYSLNSVDGNMYYYASSKVIENFGIRVIEVIDMENFKPNMDYDHWGTFFNYKVMDSFESYLDQLERETYYKRK